VKKIICVLLAYVTMLSLMLTGPAASEVSAASDATVRLSAEKQVIRGFGGMNHPAWIGDLTAAQRETAFGNGQNQLGFSILRIHVDENRNNWYREWRRQRVRSNTEQSFLLLPGIRQAIWLRLSIGMETHQLNG